MRKGMLMGFTGLACLLLWLTTQAQTPSAPASASAASAPADPLGILAAAQRIRQNLPTGRGVIVGHVEGQAGSYLPRPFDDGWVTYHPFSGEGGVNGHATSTALKIYGKGGSAPGVRDVYCYTSTDWIGPAYLRAGTGLPPRIDEARLFTHSWIGGNSPLAIDALRRLDYVVDTHDVMIVAGVNNGRGSPVPALLGSAYNVIAVGTNGGNNSSGGTRVETPGRSKPDLTAPAGQTSFSTPMVAGIVARLIEAADAADRQANRPRTAAQSETLRAVLLAGAGKPAGWTQTPTRPLDPLSGAGAVHFDRSLRILENGPTGAGRIRTRYGWDLAQLPARGRTVYRIVAPQALSNVSILLAWNRRVIPLELIDARSGRTVWTPRPMTSDFNLTLTLIDAYGRERPAAASRSAVDNVEHLYLAQLAAGVYELTVTRDDDGPDAWDYALAWRMEWDEAAPVSTPVSTPAAEPGG